MTRFTAIAVSIALGTGTPAAAASFDAFQGGTDAITAWQAAAGSSEVENFEGYAIAELVPALPDLGLTFGTLPTGYAPAIYRHATDTSGSFGRKHIGNFPTGTLPGADRYSNLDIYVDADTRLHGFGFVNGDGQPSTTVLTAYDDNGDILGSVSAFRSQFAGFLTDGVVARIVLDGGAGSDGYDHWDAFMSSTTAISAVPLPFAGLMLPVALLGLGVFGRTEPPRFSRRLFSFHYVV